MGFEPTTPGTTNQCSNQLSYSHRFTKWDNFRAATAQHPNWERKVTNILLYLQ